MNKRWTMVWELMLGLLSVAVALAAPPTDVQLEVDYLLSFIEASGCAFYRNGAWHDSKTAQAHLRNKYEYLAAKDLINSTEAFIERVATKSEFGGQAYKVRCHGSTTVTSNEWLRGELARVRTYK